ncbi:S41 family peptidase [Marinifilum sp.]|uniref:S41 family peptidase n=1 Tax=Marinifilum sp. TaxID=2033137 RepID=UPI003BAC643A
MRNYLIILLLLISTISNGQENPYLSDFEYFIEKLIETHPDPYTGFGGRIGFFKEKEKFKNRITDSLTNDEFVILINQFLSKLNDGHTNLYFNKSENIEQKYFPMQFKVSSDKVFINNTIKEYKNLIGKPIVQINDIEIDTWRKKAKSFLPSENISGEYYNLIKIIADYQLSLKFFESSNSLKLKFNNGDSEIISYKTEQVKYLDKKSKIEFENDNGLLYYSMIGKNKNIGYLAWNSILSREVVQNTYKNSPDWIQGNLNWAYNYLNEKQSGDIEQDILRIPSLYEQFYKLSKEMREKNSKYLIIDLRENSGGMTPIVNPLLYVLYGKKYLNFDFGAEMIRRISPLYLQKIGFSTIEDFNQTYYSNFKIGDYTFGSFGNINPNLSFEQKKKMVRSGYNGFGAEYLKKTKPMTDVKIFVLCSAKTFSAAYHFIYFLKRLGRTTIFGVASRQAGIAFMETTNVSLPETKIRGSLSNSKQILFEENSQSAQILRPDHEMNWEDYKKYDFDPNSELLKILEMTGN